MALPDSTSPILFLTHPTLQELTKISTLTHSSWGDSLALPDYLEESTYLTTIPLAKNSGTTSWILTCPISASHSDNERPILASCETFRKRALVSRTRSRSKPNEHDLEDRDRDEGSDEDRSGTEVKLEEGIIHGIASVFCDPTYRGKGYASSMMRELSSVLRTWQEEEHGNVFGSILYSDIGKEFYSRLGWKAVERNVHIEILVAKLDDGLHEGLAEDLQGFDSRNRETGNDVRLLKTEDLRRLCVEDEGMIREAMSKVSGKRNVCGSESEKRISNEERTKVIIIPDFEHMQWHHCKEEFASEKLYGKTPTVKGACVGEVPNRMWVIWTHRFYEDPRVVKEQGVDGDASVNTLYILRLVREHDVLGEANSQDEMLQKGSGFSALKDVEVEKMREILLAARKEANDWGLKKIVLWDPTPDVQELIAETGIPYSNVVRKEEGIAGMLWYGNQARTKDEVDVGWLANEKYAWC